MNKLYEETSIQDIANAIREKNGSTDTYTVGEMGNAIREIESGGGDIDALIDRSITEITSNVTNIGSYAFNACKKLTTINLPKVTSIGSYAFSDCSSLTTADFPFVTSIENFTFNGCRILKNINLPNITRITSYAFQSCLQLTNTIIGTEKTTVCALLNANAFTNTSIANGTGFIYVPDNLVDSYKTATNWATYANQIKGISELAT